MGDVVFIHWNIQMWCLPFTFLTYICHAHTTQKYWWLRENIGSLGAFIAENELSEQVIRSHISLPFSAVTLYKYKLYWITQLTHRTMHITLRLQENSQYDLMKLKINDFKLYKLDRMKDIFWKRWGEYHKSYAFSKFDL